MSIADRGSVLVGLIGEGIQQSLTPALHEREGDEQGLRYLYRLIDLDQLGLSVEALPALLVAAEQMGFRGLNITHPCKQAVVGLLHELSPEARLLGAVNTVVFQDGRRYGYNTDAFGFAENFSRSFGDARREKVVQLGAGGAGAAVAYAALSEGVETLLVFDPDRRKSEHVVEMLQGHFGFTRAGVGEDLAATLRQADGLIHATPTGMDKHPGLPLPRALLRPDLWVAEIVYFPVETELLRAARAIGCRTLDGTGMAVLQAVGAFRLFTGIAPDVERMFSHLSSLLHERTTQGK